MTNGGGTPSAEEKAKKIKSLLTSYYTADQDPSLGDAENDPASGSTCRTPSSVQSSSSQFSRAHSAATPLNTTYFNPEAYLKRTLKETRLADLTQKHRSLLAEVGSLDSDMQMLVYENYSKFVSATDTIKVMNSSMGSVVEDMNSLQQLIESVVDRSNNVNGKLQQRQDTIEELNQVRLLLHKLQGVFDLPSKLRAALDREAYDVAVESFADVIPLLRNYGHKAAFKRVKHEVEKCRQELSALLRRRLTSNPDAAADCIAMIAKLGEPTETLQEEFLKCKRDQMEEWLQIARIALKASAVKNGLLDPSELGAVDESLQEKMHQWFPGEELPSLYTVLIGVDSRFLSELTHTSALYSELFEPGGRKRLVKVARDVFQRYFNLARRALSDAAATSAAGAAGIRPTGDLLQPLHQYVPLLREQSLHGRQGLEAAQAAEAGVDGSIASDWGSDSLMQALYVVKNDIARLDSMLPELNPKDRAGELVEHTVRQHVGLCFSALERRVMATVAALHSELGAAAQSGAVGRAGRHAVVQDSLHLLNQIVYLGVDRLLASLKAYEQERWVLHSWLDVFRSLVQAQLQNLYQSVSRQLLALSKQAAPQTDSPSEQPSPERGSTPPNEAVAVDTSAPFAAISRRASLQPLSPGGGDVLPLPPLLLLLLCHFLHHMERELVPQAHQRVMELYSEGGRRGGSRRDGPLAFSAAELERHLSSSSQALLCGFVDAYGQLLAMAVQRSNEVTDWANHKEPRAPRPVCDYVLEKVAEADTDIACVTDAGHASTPHSRASSVHHHSHSSSGVGAGGFAARQESNAAASMMETAVTKVFSQRDGSDALELGREPLLSAILSKALSALVRCVRASTLGRAGFQQVQLDVHYLRPRLQQFVADGAPEGREVMQLLDELLGAAMERCSQPLMLDTAVLDKIVAQATAQRAQQQQQGLL